MNTDNIKVERDERAQRFAARVEEHIAVLEYERSGNRIVFTHTLVPPAVEGRGVASKLAHAALEYAREQHLSVVPRCSFVAAYVRRHPEYKALVAA